MGMLFIKDQNTVKSNLCLVLSTLDNSNLLGKSNKVRVIGSSKQITASKQTTGSTQISKKKRRDYKYHTHFTGMDTESELEEDKKSNDKELTRLFWNKFSASNFCTVAHRFFFLLLTCHVLKTWFELSRVKSYRNNLKGNKNYFELYSGSQHRYFQFCLIASDGYVRKIK